MDLTDKQKELFQLMKRKKKISLDELASALEKNPGMSDKDFRKSIIVRIKYLTARLAPEGWIITKITGVGCGVKAVYSIEKRF